MVRSSHQGQSQAVQTTDKPGRAELKGEPCRFLIAIERGGNNSSSGCIATGAGWGVSSIVSPFGRRGSWSGWPTSTHSLWWPLK